MADDHAFHGVGLEHQKRFKEWWMVARQSEEPPSPQEYFENFGVSSQLVNKMLHSVLEESLPEETEAEEEPSRYLGPGAIDYFSYHCTPSSPAYTSDVDKLLEKAMRNTREKLEHDGSWEDQPTEQDLISLADATAPMNWEPILDSCMTGKYSSDFMLSLFRRVPDHDSLQLNLAGRRRLVNLGNPAFRQALDHDCALVIKEVLNKLCSVSLQPDKWEKEAFLDCFGLLFQSTSLKELGLHLPITLLEEDAKGGNDGSLALSSTTGKSVTCGIQKYTVEDKCNVGTIARATESPWLGVESLALVALHRMPHLKVLDLECGRLHLESASPHIVQLLENKASQLEHLKILAWATKERPTKTAALDILEALKNNSSLTGLTYEECADIALESCSLYARTLLQVLQDSNTTLTIASFYPEFNRVDLKLRIDHYLSLNKFGRKIARDASTSVTDIVSLLSPKASPSPPDEDRIRNALFINPRYGYYNSETDSDDESCIDLENLQINYGLLREMPVTWISHVCSAFTSGEGGGTRKRKRVPGAL